MVSLRSQSELRAIEELTRGILNSSLVHLREVYRTAILAGPAGIILVHNHPSGDPTPSADDRAVTRQLVDAGRLLDVPCYDHVIIAGDRYASFAEAGCCDLRQASRSSGVGHPARHAVRATEDVGHACPADSARPTPTSRARGLSRCRRRAGATGSTAPLRLSTSGGLTPAPPRTEPYWCPAPQSDRPLTWPE